MIECGYTWEYIDRHMDMKKLAALMARWKEVPPAGTILDGIAQKLGVKWERGKRSNAEDEAKALARAKAEAAFFNTGGRP